MDKNEKEVQEALGTYRQCQTLDINELECEHPALLTPFHYHGDPEIYGCDDERPGWVFVYLCEQHSKKLTEHFKET